MSTEFTANQPFDRVFLLKSIDERLTRNGKPYLAMVLGTPSEDLEARVWDMDLKSLPGLVEGDPVKVRGTSQLYQDKLQIVVDTIEKAGSTIDPREIYPSSLRPEKELRKEFHIFIEGIRNNHLAELMNTMREDTEIFDVFLVSPAAVAMHHARIGGLAEHSLDVCRIALAVSDIWPRLDRDMLTAGAILHDIGKIREYQVAGDFRYTLDGKLVGHIVRGVSIVENWLRGLGSFPERLALDLLHIILSHHGTLEHGSPKAPATAEALVIHYADDLDAKLDMIRSASEGEDSSEAYVRGLRRMFQFKNEEQGGGRRAEGGENSADSRQETGDRRKKAVTASETESCEELDESDNEDDQRELF
jgi:3'-5' exoribonuclease